MDKFQVEIQIPFRAGHRLVNPYVGKCNNVHGEGYTSIIIFEKNKLDQNGMVFDFGKIKLMVKEWIDNNLDHAYIYHINDEVGDYLKTLNLKVFCMGNHNPTAEEMAKLIFNIIQTTITPCVKRVGIVESFKDSVAWYQNED